MSVCSVLFWLPTEEVNCYCVAITTRRCRRSRCFCCCNGASGCAFARHAGSDGHPLIGVRRPDTRMSVRRAFLGNASSYSMVFMGTIAAVLAQAAPSAAGVVGVFGFWRLADDLLGSLCTTTPSTSIALAAKATNNTLNEKLVSLLWFTSLHLYVLFLLLLCRYRLFVWLTKQYLEHKHRRAAQTCVCTQVIGRTSRTTPELPRLSRGVLVVNSNVI